MTARVRQPTAVDRPVRRRQPDRVEAMRNRLLDATIDCLADSGYSGFSTNEVVRRAGVSRGALAHHFPAKADLIAAAANRLIDLRAREFEQRFAAIPPDQRTVASALDVLWSFFDDSSFHALHELMVAARSEPELAPVMAAGSRHAAQVTREVFGAAFPVLAQQPFVEPTLDAILALYTGLAAQVALDGDPAGRAAAVRALLKGALTLATASFAPSPDLIRSSEEQR